VILPTVHLPAVYRVSDVHSEGGQALHCSMCLQVLFDAVENCVLLVDEGGALRTELARAVRAWPIKHRKRGEALLHRLNDRHRFVEVPTPSVANDRSSLCTVALAVAATDGTAWTIVPTTCTCSMIACSGANNARVVRLAEYTASEFNERRRAAARLDAADGEWTRGRFEHEVWRPLFTFARFVHLHDKSVGSKATVDGPAPNFRRTLEWILTLFLRHSQRKSSDRPFKIYTVFPHDDLAACRAIKDYALSLEREHAFPVQILHARVGHDRYLFTDQIGLKVSRGFDLLGEDTSAGPRQKVRAVSLDLFRPFEDLS